MSGPQILRVKRRVEEEPLDVLVLDQASQRVKRPKIGDTHYLRKKAENEEPRARPIVQPESSADTEKRILRLKRGREDADDGLATFVEKRPKSNTPAKSVGGKKALSDNEVPGESLKRPSRRAAVKRAPDVLPTDIETTAERNQVQAMADYMHQAALEEVEREAQPRPVTKPTPKLSGHRSREIHDRRAAKNGSSDISHDVVMEDEGEYVLDTYILASDPVDAHIKLNNIGYLVITDEDQSLWETYLEDEAGSDKDVMSDEDDENAEDYYGADYPEDDLVSDDEYDRNPYSFRRRAGSNDEEWDEDTGAYSDEEHERMMEPFKAKRPLQQFAKYLGGEDADSD